MIPLGVLASARVASGGGSGAGYLTYADTGTGTTTRTYTGVDFGTAASNRHIILAVHARSQNISSVTIGGVSATIHAAFTDGVSRTAIVSAAVPTGATGTVVVTHAGSPSSSAIGVYAAYGTLTYDSSATEGAGKTVTLTAPTNALLIGAMTNTATTADGDWPFTTPTGDYADYVAAASPLHASAAHDQPAAGSYSFVVTNGLTNYANSSMLAVAFTLT